MAMELEVAPVGRGVKAYFAPVGTGFDASLGTVSAPWVDLGFCTGFKRTCGTRVEALVAGAPGVCVGQVRTLVEAEVQVEFERWGKLQMAMTCGTQQMNLLRDGVAAVAPGVDSTASALNVGAAAAGFVVGDLVAVDVDYSGQTGLVGSGVAGGFVAAALSDVDYVRRVSLNVGRVVSIADGVLELEGALLAGVPAAGMKVSRVAGFCDREGTPFFQEWAGLFVVEGMQGERVCFFYPRLQSATGVLEESSLVGGLERRRLLGRFRGLGVADGEDGVRVVCYRSYLPG